MPEEGGSVSFGPTTADGDDVSRLIGLAESLGHEVAQRRSLLRATWLKSTQDIQRADKARQMIAAEVRRQELALREKLKQFSTGPDQEFAARYRREAPRPTADTVLVLDANGEWILKPEIVRQFNDALAIAQQKFIEARRKTFAWRVLSEGAIQLAKCSVWLEGLRELETTALGDQIYSQALRDRAQIAAAE